MKQRRFRFALLATIVGIALMAAVPTFASQARIVRLSQIEGDVQIDRGGVGLEKAVLNMPVIEGTRIVAENDATVEVEFENGGTMRIVGPATVNFRELSMRNEGDKVTLIDLQPGIYYFDIKHKGDDDFRVSVADDTLRVAKSVKFRVDGSNDDVKVSVFKGELKLEGANREVAIKSDETLTLDATDAGRYYLAKGTDSLFSDSWDRERDQYREQYAKADTWKYANNSYGSPYSYGFSDLNQYGNYFNVPGYGYMWRPSMYDASWDPFSNGAWSYYPGQGWMFVSMYPWGWAPYRYGQWVYVPSWGWCWRPGHRYNNWNPVPVVRNPPPGTWRRPLPPTTTWKHTVFVNPAPVVSNGPQHTWRRPVPTQSGWTHGSTTGNGATGGIVVSPTVRRPGGTWTRNDKLSEVGNDQSKPAQSTQGVEVLNNTPRRDDRRDTNRRDTVDRNEHRTWQRVTPPQQPRAAPMPVVPAQAQPTQPAQAPQRSVTPPPQRQVEPPRGPSPERAPHIDHAPAVERSGGDGHATPAPASPGGHRSK